MLQIVNYIILAAYLVSLYSIGRFIMRAWFAPLPRLLSVTGSVLVGTGIGVPVTYIFACLFTKTGNPIEWGVGGTIALVAVICFLFRHNRHQTLGEKLCMSDLILIVFSLAFSYWLMTKTFHGDTAGQLFVGSNNIFDFGHALGIIRSFSWGNRFPLISPFQSGLPFFYHFFFYFWVSIWEYFGVPIVWAMNIPSILSFTALLISIYLLPQILLKQTRLVGWIAVLLTITHSTLTFWFLMLQKGINHSFLQSIWRLPAYPFAGPFDGSTISLFMTLNNYVNQRHLAFATAFGLVLIMLCIKFLEEKHLTARVFIAFGVCTACMFLWNSMISVSTALIIILLLLRKKFWKEIMLFVTPIVIAIFIIVLPILPFLKNVLLFETGLIAPAVTSGSPLQQWNIFQYLWENLGILPLVAFCGYFVIPKKKRSNIIPFVIVFVLLCLYAAYRNHGFDQKFLSFFIIGVNILAASGVVWMWHRKNIIFKILAIGIFFVLTISGIVDLMVIKNEFAYPFVSTSTASVITWIKNNTPKNAVFVSYSDMIDPVVLAGRSNFYGFFGNIVQPDRSGIVRSVYSGDLTDAKRNAISYVLVPKWNKNDFPYDVDVKLLRNIYRVVYEDDKVVIFRI